MDIRFVTYMALASVYFVPAFLNRRKRKRVGTYREFAIASLYALLACF
jgi:hypothetical protein